MPRKTFTASICGHQAAIPDAKLCRACWKTRGTGADGGRTQHIASECGHPASVRHAKLCSDCYRQRPRKTYLASVCGHEVAEPHLKFCQTCYQTRGPNLDQDQIVARLKGETSIYRKAYEKTVKERADEERLMDLFRTSIARFPELPASVFRVPSKRTVASSSSVDVPALLLGDQQIGEAIRLEETSGINHYNFAVYQARLEHLEDRVVDILTDHQTAPFSELVVFSMGDNVSGVIHDELQKYGHQHIVDQVYLGALTVALFLYRLQVRLAPRGVKTIRVSCVSGNHGRLSKDKESKQYYKNFDLLFNGIVAQALARVPSIQFHIPRCLFTVVDVAGNRILQSHGHEMPPSSLGIPLYSINRASAGYQELLSWTEATRFDYWVMGHFHRPMELDNAIVNGTMAGLGEFGIGRFKPIRPAQKLLGFHPKYGKAWEYPIRLDLAPPEPSVYTFEPEMDTTDALAMFSERFASVRA